MELQKFYGIMGYYPMKILGESHKMEYKYKILAQIEEQMERRLYNDYSKYFLYLSYRKIDNDMTALMKSWSKTESPETMEFLSQLKNLTKNVKRVVYVKKTKTFPDCFSEMTTPKLVEFIKDYGRSFKLKSEPEVTMLKTDKYLKLAENLWPEAEKYYYTKK